MTTETKSPSTDELFNTSPTQEAKASPDAEVKEEKEEKAVEPEVSDNGKEKPKEKESKSEDKSDDEASSDSEVKPSDDKEAKDTTDYEQRYKETHKWGNEANTKAVKLEAELKKIKEEYGIVEDTVSEEENAKILETKIKTSETIERANHGDEFIDKTLYAEDSIWQKVKHDPLIDMRVRMSDSPISEALKVVKEQEFHSKYGNDPDKIVEKIKAELEPELMKKLKEEFEGKLKQKDSLGSNLSNVKNDQVTEEKGFKNPSTSELFD